MRVVCWNVNGQGSVLKRKKIKEILGRASAKCGYDSVYKKK